MFESLTHIFSTVIPFIIVLSVLIFVHEFGHFWVARRCGVRVEKFSLGFGKELFGWTRGDTRYSVSAIPFGGFVKMAGEQPEAERKGEPWEYFTQPMWRRFLIVSAGPAVNYIVGFILLFGLYLVGNPKLLSTVGTVTEGYPAVEAGIEVGDRIVSIDGEKVRTFSDVMFAVQDKVEGPIEIVVKRADETQSFSILPLVESGVDRYGRKKDVARIGVGPAQEIVKERYSLFDSLALAGKDTMFFTRTTYQGLWYLVTGQVAFRKSVTGPIGILVITGETARLGIAYLVQFMALISITLAIFNYLPIPILDGGHILFMVCEKLKGKPLSIRFQEGVQQAAFALLITLMLVVSINDLINFKVFERLVEWLPIGGER